MQISLCLRRTACLALLPVLNGSQPKLGYCQLKHWRRELFSSAWYYFRPCRQRRKEVLKHYRGRSRCKDGRRKMCTERFPCVSPPVSFPLFRLRVIDISTAGKPRSWPKNLRRGRAPFEIVSYNPEKQGRAPGPWPSCRWPNPLDGEGETPFFYPACYINTFQLHLPQRRHKSQPSKREPREILLPRVETRATLNNQHRLEIRYSPWYTSHPSPVHGPRTGLLERGLLEEKTQVNDAGYMAFGYSWALHWEYVVPGISVYIGTITFCRNHSSDLSISSHNDALSALPLWNTYSMCLSKVPWYS